MKEVHNCQVTVTHAPKFQGKFWMFSCSFMQSFNVPTRMIWGFPTPSVLYTKLWKFLPLKNHSFTRKFGHSYVCASRSPCQAPLGTQKASFFLFPPNTSFTLQPIEQGWDIEESWQQCCVFWLWTTSVSQSYKRVRAPWLQGYFHSCQPAEDDGSPSCSPWWEPILLISLALHLQHFRILFSWAWLKKF